jgi:hypothetical protein
MHPSRPSSAILRRAIPAFSVLALAACRAPEVREERHPDGKIKSSSFHLAREAGEVLHGARQTWHPSGARASLDVYVYGYLQGYSLRWDEGGRLRSLVRYVDGLPDGEARSWDARGNLVLCRTAGGGDCLAEDGRAAGPESVPGSFRAGGRNRPETPSG